MNMRERKQTKYNAESVDRLFGVMFETLWLPVYDARCHDAAYVEFGRCARRAVVLLSTTDPATCGEEDFAALRFALCELRRSVDRIAASGRFAPARCRAAREVVGQLVGEVENSARGVKVCE